MRRNRDGSSRDGSAGEGGGTVSIEKAAADSARRLRTMGVRKSPVCLVLGSGFRGVTSVLSGTVTVPYGRIPGMPSPSTEGHAGLLHAGRMGGHEAIVFEGRKHYYECSPPERMFFPVFLARALGVKCFLQTCAAGAVSHRLEAGDLLLVEDHINLGFRSPLTGVGARGFGRFVDMYEAYDEGLKTALKEAAAVEGVKLETGTLAQVLGPSYETRAEICAMDRWGIDAVTMSTVPEVIMARYLGLGTACLALVTNSHRTRDRRNTTHEEVLETASKRVGMLFRVLERAVGSMHF